MKKIRDFKPALDPSSARELSRQLRQLEDNTSDAFDAAALVAQRRLAVRKRITSANGERVAPGQSLGIAATVTSVQLDPIGPADAGKFLAICKGPGAPSNTVVFAPSSALINGSPSYTITANAILQLFYCDGVDYWTPQ